MKTRPMNVFKDVTNHSITLISNSEGKPLKRAPSLLGDRPKGMSGRQWKKLRKKNRKAQSQ